MRSGVGRRMLTVAMASVGGLALLARLRPVPDLSTPEAAVVTGCAWVAWLLAGYLCLAMLGSALGVAARHRPVLRRRLDRVLTAAVPAGLRRTVELTVSAGVAAVLVGAAPVAQAATASRLPTGVHAAAHDPLEWPGLSRPAPPPPRTSVAARDSGPHPGAHLVRPGETLWQIAAEHLAGHPSRAQVAAAWPRWYAANRTVIGADPDLIHPGQRLVPPPTTGRTS